MANIKMDSKTAVPCKGSRTKEKRQFMVKKGWRLLSAGLLAVLAGCSSSSDENKVQRGQIGYVSGFYGGVIADEPRAALVGRDILSKGGKAADAAAAIYFALTVTMPSRASLASGGACLVYEGKTQRSETLDFRLQTPQPATGQGEAVPVPTAPLAFYLLHSKYGRRLPWSSLVIPAENLARFGNQVSRAFARDIRVAGNFISNRPDLKKLLENGSGNIAGEGDFLRQLNLSAELASIRAKTSGDIYHGAGGRKLLDAIQLGGGKMDQHALQNYRPTWRDTKKVGYVLGTQFIFPDAGPATNTGADAIINALKDKSGFTNLSATERDKRFLQTLAGKLPQRQFDQDPMKNTVSSFLVVDRVGNAVACNLTMNNLFGSGRVAKGLGIVLGAAPKASTEQPLFNAMMLVSVIRPTFVFGAAGGAGMDDTAAMTRVALDTFADEKNETTLENVINKGRMFQSPLSGGIVIESTVNADRAAQLSTVTRSREPLGRLNAMFCSTGVPNEKGEQCQVKTDPRGFGLAVSNDS